MSKDGAVLDNVTFDDFADLFEHDELRTVIDEWHVDSICAVDAIEAAMQRREPAEIGKIAHRVAGGGLALGAMALVSHCEVIRRTAESGGAVTAADIQRIRQVVADSYRAMAQSAGL